MAKTQAHVSHSSDQPLLAIDGFHDVQTDALQQLQATIHQRHCRHNEVIYLQEDDVDGLFVILQGHVRLSYMMEDGSAVLYGILNAGKIFGELGIFDGGQQCDMASSVGESVIGRIDAAKFKRLCARFPVLNDRIALQIAQRFRSYIELTRIMSLRRLQSRISLALLRLADSLNQHTTYEGRQYLIIGPVVTQTDLAVMARGSRGNINRTLKAWERQGWIAMRNRTILIMNRAALEAVAIEDGL